MSEDNFEEPMEDLQLAEKILELTTFIQSISTKLESLSTTVRNLEKNFQDLDVKLGKKFTLNDERYTGLQELHSNHNLLQFELEKTYYSYRQVQVLRSYLIPMPTRIHLF